MFKQARISSISMQAVLNEIKSAIRDGLGQQRFVAHYDRACTSWRWSCLESAQVPSTDPGRRISDHLL